MFIDKLLKHERAEGEHILNRTLSPLPEGKFA